MNRTIASLLLCTALSSSDAFASDRQLDACMSRSGGVTSEMLSCIGEAQERADARLATTLAKVSGSLSTSRRASLQNAQKVWLAYREAHCDFLADPDGGTSAALMAADCWLTLTQDRLEFLDTLVDHSTVLLR